MKLDFEDEIVVVFPLVGPGLFGNASVPQSKQ